MRGCNNLYYILGGNGFVGSAFIRHFKQKKIEYVNITKENYNEYTDSSCDVFINANGNSKKYLARKEPITDFDMNVRMALKTTQDFKYKMYVLISSIDVYNTLSDPKHNSEETPITPEKLSNYGFDKYLTEYIIKKYCTNWLIFRLGGMVGKDMAKGPVYDILQNGEIYVHPDSQFQFINTDEVAEILFTIINKKISNEIFNVCGTGSLSIKDIASILNQKIENNEYNRLVYEINNKKIQTYKKLSSTKETIKNIKV